MDKKKRNIFDVGPGVVSGILPCGYLDNDGVLHTDFVVHELSGAEEDLLAGTGPSIPRLDQVMVNCIDSIGSVAKGAMTHVVKQLLAVDRAFLLIAIRRATLGDMYKMKIKCPKPTTVCGTVSRVELDMSKLDVVNPADPMQRKFVDECSDGTRITWHAMNGNDELWLSTVPVKIRRGSRVTMAMLARVDAIDDVVLNRHTALKEAIVSLKGLGGGKRNWLRSRFVEAEGDVDTDIEFTCPDCHHEFVDELEMTPDFFFPAGI